MIKPNKTFLSPLDRIQIMNKKKTFKIILILYFDQFLTFVLFGNFSSPLIFWIFTSILCFPVSSFFSCIYSSATSTSTLDSPTIYFKTYVNVINECITFMQSLQCETYIVWGRRKWSMILVVSSFQSSLCKKYISEGGVQSSFKNRG